MGLRPDQVPDLVNLTLSQYKPGKWVDLSLSQPTYVSSRIIAKATKEWGAPDIRFKTQLKNSDLARNAGMFDTDITGIEDLSGEGVLKWTLQTVNWSYSIDEEVFQTDRETIVSSIVMRDHACKNSMTVLNESNFWGAPANSASKAPMGMPFWMQKDATTTPGGAFNGGNPAGFTAGAADIDSAAVPAWKNWTFGYDSLTSDDCVSKVKLALYKTKFVAPNPHPEHVFGKADYNIFTTYVVRAALERLAESRNDNLGKDVAKYINAVTIGGVPVEACHYLDENDSTDPLYGVNWGVFHPYCKRQVNMRRTQKDNAASHTMKETHYDTYMNYACLDRRQLWVGSTS